jgi:histone H3/H4
MPPKVSSSTGKRRPSAYISFSTQNRESVKRELAEKGNLKPGMGDIAKLISQRWNALSEEEKQKFKEKCEREFDEKEEKERKERGNDKDLEKNNNNNADKNDMDDDDDEDNAAHGEDGLTEAERLVQQTQMQSMMNQDKDGNSLSLPLSRVKRIMKLDKSVKVASGDATKLITKATELFCEMLTQNALGSMKLGKRKTIKYLDVERAVLKKQKFDFLHDHISAMKPKEGEPKKMTEKDVEVANEDGENAKKEVDTHGSKKISDFFAKKKEEGGEPTPNEEVAAA